MTRRIALATAPDWADLIPEDRLLLDPLRRLGIEAEPALWDDPAVEWNRYDAILIRSCWDYSWRLQEFLDWIGRIERTGVPLWNPPATIRANIDKLYLNTIQTAGIETVSTVWAEQGSELPLEHLFASRGWDEVVIKPVISAGARDTWRVQRPHAAEHQARVDELLAANALMVQPFLSEIITAGEWSLLFFGGHFSHAVVKRPAPGDFRVQPQHGGITTPAIPPGCLVQQAEKALHVMGHDCLYARVDGVLIGDQLLIMEMELTEPRLFLDQDKEAPRRLSEAIAAKLL